MKYQTIDLFAQEDIHPPIEQLISQAKAVLRRLLIDGVPIVVAYSGGRDSGVVSSLVLDAAREVASTSAVVPRIVVTSANTLVESPEIVKHVEDELDRMTLYAERHKIDLTTKVVIPNLTSTFQVKVLTGRGLPSFAGAQSDCTTDLKLSPQIRFRKQLFAGLADEHLPEPVTCIGTRFSESERRALNMRLRNESASTPSRNKADELVLSLIAWWTVDDLTEYIGLCASGLVESYTDFSETSRIYAHAAGTSCSVVADAINEGVLRTKVGKCGARTGCWTCLQAEDKSLENMIEFDPRYEYARGLNKFNKFLRATRYFWKLRHWVGRTIRAGHVVYQPDTYHPIMLRFLTRLMLQLDHDEMMRARAADEERRFTILPVEMMIAVDALQSLNGVAVPFAIWADYRDIFQRGIRYTIPDVPATTPDPMPTARFIYVGDDWSDTIGRTWSGRRDPYWEAMTEGSPCAPELVPLKDGTMAWDFDTSQSFEVDPESATMIALFELDHLFNMFDNGFTPSGATAAYKWYLRFGCLKLSHSMRESHDMIMRRTEFKAQLGFGLDYDPDELVKKTISYAELPAAAREAWRHKATTESSQTLFQF